jgi:hypothetical protein
MVMILNELGSPSELIVWFGISSLELGDTVVIASSSLITQSVWRKSSLTFSGGIFEGKFYE